MVDCRDTGSFHPENNYAGTQGRKIKVIGLALPVRTEELNAKPLIGDVAQKVFCTNWGKNK